MLDAAETEKERGTIAAASLPASSAKVCREPLVPIRTKQIISQNSFPARFLHLNAMIPHTTAPTARNSSIIPESWFPVFGASVWMQFALLHLKDLLYLYGCFWIILQNKSEFDIKSKFIHFIQWQPDGIVSTSLQITLSPYGLSVGLLAGNRSCIPSAWYSELRISSKYVSYKDWKALVRSWIYCSVSKDSSSLHSETKSS